MNLNHYINARKEIQQWFLKQKDPDIVYCVSLISASSHVPAIACAFFIGEVADWPEELLVNIDNLIRDYSYTNIVGIPDGYMRRKV